MRRGQRLRFALLALGGPALIAAALLLAIVSLVYRAQASPGLTTQNLSGPLQAQDLAGSLVGFGVTISNATYTGAEVAAGSFDGGSGIVGFNSGVVLSSGLASNVVGLNTYDSVSGQNNTAGDAGLTALSGHTTYDASVLEFDFVPTGSTVSFNYVFGSDEYNEYVHDAYNDVFAFFVNGVNCATIGGSPVSINTINNGRPFNTDPRENPSLYRNNDLQDGGGAIETELDGLTSVLTCVASVNPNVTNHIKLAIADASDYVFDSDVFLEGGSFAVPTATATATASATATATATPSQTATSTATSTPTATITPPDTPTHTPTFTPTPTNTATPSPTPTIPPAEVQVGSTSEDVGGASTVTVQAIDVSEPGLATWTLDVKYDPDILAVTGCSALHGGVCDTGFAADTVRITGSTSDGLVGSIGLGSVSFRCIGVGVSPLSLLLHQLSSAEGGQQIPALVQNGSMTCVQPPPTATRTPTATGTATPTSTRTATVIPSATNTPVPQPTETPTPFFILLPASTSTPTPTPVPPTPTATRASEVLPTERPPKAPSDPRPKTTSAILAPDAINTSAGVIATNFLLGLALLIALFLASSVFNFVIEDNHDIVAGMFAGITAPIVAVGSFFTQAERFVGPLATRIFELVVGPLIILALTGLIYSFNDPSWGFNQRSLVLFLSVVIAAGFGTLIFEGGESFVHRHRHHVNAGIRLYPLAIVIALIFVAISRAVQFEAPIMYGFIAAATILGPAQLNARQEGFAIFVPSVAILLLGLSAWGLLVPLREFGLDHTEWWGVLPEAVAAMFFASAIEALLFAMIPLEFMDGIKIMRWNRLGWLVLFAVPAFLFCWVILNPETESFESLLQGRVILAVTLVGIYVVLAAITWVYFFLRSRREHQMHDAFAPV